MYVLISITKPLIPIYERLSSLGPQMICPRYSLEMLAKTVIHLTSDKWM